MYYNIFEGNSNKFLFPKLIRKNKNLGENREITDTSFTLSCFKRYNTISFI